MRAVAEIISRRGDCDTLWRTRREIAMGLIKDLLDLGSQALAGFKDNIPTLLAVIAVTCCKGRPSVGFPELLSHRILLRKTDFLLLLCEAFPISAHQ